MTAKIVKAIFISVILGTVYTPLFAQWADNFDDGNFTNNPAWIGNTDEFIVDAGQLRLNAPAQTGSSYLSTLSDISLEASWSFLLTMDFNPSSSNYAKVYLMADVEDLSNVQNGYFIKIGGTSDEISLYKVESGNETILIDGVDGRVSLSSVEVEIHVTRDATNIWALKSKLNGETDFVSEGNMLDSSITSSAYFGWYCKYTSTRSTKFYLDAIVVTGTAFVDDVAPKLLGYSTPTNTQILLAFNEPLDTTQAKTVANFVLNDTINAANVSVINVDTLLVEFGSPLSLINELSIINLPDTTGNKLDTLIQLLFVDPSPFNYRDVVINELFPDPSPQEDLPAFEFVELYNNSDRIIDVTNWTFTDGTKTGILSTSLIFPDSFLLICPIEAQGEYSQFGSALGLNNWPSLNNGGDNLILFSSDSVSIDSVNYSLSWYQDDIKNNGGWSIEQINPNGECLDSCNWAASVDPSGGTPGSINSVFDLGLDEEPPRLVEVTTPISTQVHLGFNEELDSMALNKLHYVLNDSIAPNSVILSKNSITLNFLDTLQLKNTLNIQQLSDVAGNVLDTLITFYLLDSIPQKYRVIVINEVFPDPNPQEELPLFEFVELFNNSNKTINLNGWQYSDGSKTFTFPNQLIYPDSFLIICPTVAATEYQLFGETLGLSSWPTLNNGGDSLTLIDITGNLIDSLNYSNNWYNDTSKGNGGWSLEQINPNRECLDSCNWAASVDISGGTPGRTNSIFDLGLDEEPPRLVEITTPISTQVHLGFNEELDSMALNKLHYVLNDSIAPNSVILSKNSITLNFLDTLQLKNTLNIQQLSDVADNVLDTLITFYLLDSIPQKYRVIVINEVFPDPNPQEDLPLFEFVELFNNSNKTINLNGWQYSDGSKTFTFPNQLIYPDSFLIICPTAAATEYQLFGETLGLSSWPTLNNGGDSLTLIDITGNLIDSLNYSNNWYNDTSKGNGGWSLEQINPNGECLDSCNWAASVDISGGTPGRTNSIFDLGLDEEPPQILSVFTPSINKIGLIFNETLDPVTSVNKANYSLNDNANPIQITIKSDSILLEFETNLKLENALKLTNIADTSGNILDTLFTVYYINPEPVQYRDVVINELFADPSPQEDLPLFEFVELLNLSDKIIDLKGWKFADSSKEVVLNSYLLFPDSFLIICPLEAKDAYLEYGKTLGLSTWPTLNNSGETLSLSSSKGQVIDSISYNTTWYKNADKKEGGWSLEQINPLSICLGSFNWVASADKKGGSPGKQNTIYNDFADATPTIITQALLTGTKVEVWLSKPIANGNYQGTITSPEKQILFETSKPTTYLQGELDGEKLLNTYQLEIPLKDCNNNLSVSTSILYNIYTPNRSNLIINELLFNPYAGGSDFLELYNTTEHYFNLKNLELSNETNTTIISDTTLLLRPEHYLAISENIIFLKNEYLAPDTSLFEAKLPTMPNDEGMIVLKSPSGVMIDSVIYNEDYHFSLIDDVEGISLERISASESSTLPDNWRSASESTNYATPGYENAQSRTPTNAGSITVEPQIITPNNDGQADFCQINYTLDAQSQTISIAVYNLGGQLVKTITNNAIISPNGFFTWDGTDAQGGTLPTAHYIIVTEIITSDGRVLIFRNKVVVANGF